MAYKDPQKAKEYSRTYRKVHREELREYRVARRGDRASYQRRYNLKKLYGITPEQYDSMLATQGGHCAICPATESGSKSKWHIDHDHVTGKVRGLLCHHCNLMLGNSKDHPEVLEAGAAYLRYHKARG